MTSITIRVLPTYLNFAYFFQDSDSIVLKQQWINITSVSSVLEYLRVLLEIFYHYSPYPVENSFGWQIYPLKALNLFEVLYWFVLVEAIHLTAKKKWNYALAIVFTSYVPFFLIWLVYYTQVYKQLQITISYQFSPINQVKHC